MKQFIQNKYVIGVLAVLILVLTNPSERKHQEKVMAAFSKNLSKISSQNSYESAGQTLGLFLVEALIPKIVFRNNYVLFSLTEVSFQGQSKIVGIGILGNVYLSSKVDESLNNQK
jgi:hypothetical protein